MWAERAVGSAEFDDASRPVVDRVQPRLVVGPAGDEYEQEADRVAAAVMRALSSTTRAGVGPDEVGPDALGSDEERVGAPGLRRSISRVRPLSRQVQAKAEWMPIGEGGGVVDDDTGAAISRAVGGGAALAPAIREPMEGAFGADFSRVRVHTSSGADDLNRRVQAKAFTTGADIFFSKGAYDPSSRSGQELLAHELTHVVQQGGAGVARTVRRRGSARVTVATSVTASGAVRVQRLASLQQWLDDSDISILKWRHERSLPLQEVDAAVAAYDDTAKPTERKRQLLVIADKIKQWRDGKTEDGKASPARGPKVKKLSDSVEQELVAVGLLIDAERKPDTVDVASGKILALAPHILDDLPAGADAKGAEVFQRFMNHFRGKVAYTLTTSGKVWDGGGGPFACASFATALVNLANAAGLPASRVRVDSKAFVTRVFGGAFVDTAAMGNVQIGDDRVKRYFFTEHYVTKIGERFYCPTSGVALSGITAPELVDDEIGQLDKGPGKDYVGERYVVTWIGSENGGGLYSLAETKRQ